MYYRNNKKRKKEKWKSRGCNREQLTLQFSLHNPSWRGVVYRRIMTEAITWAMFVCLFVCFTSHSKIFHSFGDVTIVCWKAANFDLCSALMAIEQWGFFSLLHLLWSEHPFKIDISEDPWHSHLLPSVWQCSSHYLS